VITNVSAELLLLSPPIWFTWMYTFAPRVASRATPTIGISAFPRRGPLRKRYALGVPRTRLSGCGALPTSGVMIALRRARAGGYAEDKYRCGLRAYRRRIRQPLLIVVVPVFLAVLVLAVTRRFDVWSLAAGALIASGIALVMFIRDDPPQYVEKWRRGAEGERKTEKALRRLERSGWSVEHDIQREGRGNLDHVARGPRGVFLLETKNLAGTITFEDGLLVARQFDDPDEVFRYAALPSQMRGRAKELSTRIGDETGKRPFVRAVVVIWGHFPNRFVEHDLVTYISGDELASWLESGLPPTNGAAI
jgi:hypothetical protein